MRVRAVIPKRLVFVWLGGEVPGYGRRTVDAFREVNPDFEVMFVHEPDLNRIKSRDLAECARLVESREYNIYRHMTVRPWAIDNFKGDLGKTVGLSDAFRLYLLNRYGGIYLDLDCWPVKAFDGGLLAYENGFAVSHERNRCDYFFMGFPAGCVDGGLIRHKREFGYGQVFSEKVHRLKYDEKYARANGRRLGTLKRKMLDGSIAVGDRLFGDGLLKEYYVDHFRMGGWRE